MDIAAHISRLVLEHECVIIPGLGAFLTNYHAAQINESQHQIKPASRSLVFNSQLNTNDGLLANHLAQRLNISYKTALQVLNVFVSYCRRDLAEGKQIAFGELGILEMNSHFKLEFHPNTTINYNEDAFGLKAIALKRIVRKPDFSLQAPLQKTVVKPKTTRVIKLNTQTLQKIAAVLIPIAVLIGAVFYLPYLTQQGANLQQTSVLSFLDSSQTNKSSENSKPDQIFDNESVEESAPVLDLEAKNELDSKAAEPANTNGFIVKESAIEQPKGQYHIICGSFIEKERAEALVGRLRAEGFDAFVAGQSNMGTYRVSMQSFNNAQDATKQVQWLRHQGYSMAWILNKNF
ncbi:MAG: SPOR domain-containing protein [Bacteroidales bacterium]|nr:SPOR domain-containing protein [Bacteroidales bacterium]